MNPQFLAVMAETASGIVLSLQKTTDREARRGLLSLLLTLCRGMQDVAPRNASIRAQARAHELGLGDLREHDFYDGARFPGGRKASMMHWEHWKPAVDLRNEILALTSPTPSAVECILKNARICWILLEEATLLRKLGHNTGRADPAESYKAAGIELAYPW